MKDIENSSDVREAENVEVSEALKLTCDEIKNIDEVARQKEAVPLKGRKRPSFGANCPCSGNCASNSFSVTGTCPCSGNCASNSFGH